MSANSIVTLSLTPNEGTMSANIGEPGQRSAGTSSTGIVTLSNPAPHGGVTRASSTNNGSTTVPLSVTVPAGSTTAPFNIAITAAAPSASAVITAAYNGDTKTGILTIGSVPGGAVTAISVNRATSAAAALQQEQ